VINDNIVIETNVFARCTFVCVLWVPRMKYNTIKASNEKKNERLRRIL
jgi:hypothetical protein